MTDPWGDAGRSRSEDWLLPSLAEKAEAELEDPFIRDLRARMQAPEPRGPLNSPSRLASQPKRFADGTVIPAYLLAEFAEARRLAEKALLSKVRFPTLAEQARGLTEKPLKRVKIDPKTGKRTVVDE